jgi:alginate O-acetyltransferase complex protein AlgI
LLAPILGIRFRRQFQTININCIAPGTADRQFMLFNSFPFFLLFLPLALIGYFLLGRVSRVAAMSWMFLTSLVFYAWWEPIYLLLLLPSVAFNYTLGRHIYLGGKFGFTAKGLLEFALGVNIVLLAVFKYADFFVSTLNALLGWQMPLPGISLPIGISFFTFTQIAFLADCYKRDVSDFNPIYYGLFVTYFPHLIAGPILHHKEMMPQFAEGDALHPRSERFLHGGVLFLMGLFKKIVLADGVAQFVAPIFDGGDVYRLTAAEAWGGALAYTLQLYFDFSAYTDMAVGLSRMFGVELPLNFKSPYKATSIVDFWRRWHMTLSRFLRDYLYIPLGGNRKGPARRYVNLAITMLLGGLWHGANWTFVIWGGLHGIYLAINHLWRDGPGKWIVIPSILGWAITFTAVVIAWVFFRANTLETAVLLLNAMAGLNGGGAANAMGGYAGAVDLVRCYAWLTVLLAIALFFSDSNALSHRVSAFARSVRVHSAMKYTALGAGLAAGIFLILIGETRGVSEFLYFNF